MRPSFLLQPFPFPLTSWSGGGRVTGTVAFPGLDVLFLTLVYPSAEAAHPLPVPVCQFAGAMECGQRSENHAFASVSSPKLTLRLGGK